MQMAAPPKLAWQRHVSKELKRFAREARGHRLRTRVEFAQQCIVIPEGPHQGAHWRPHFQPTSYWILHLMDTLGFRKFRLTGCVQSGKTLNGPVINTLWHLFERRETVIYGVPDVAETGGDKWREELLPVILSSPELRRYLPEKGRGSKGGTPTSIKFKNGATLRFMGAGGGDHRRSHFTAPVVVKTEVDRYDVAGEISREAAPVEQMEARTEAFGDRAFSYEECTVTTQTGRIWTELEKSTNTKLYVKCADCRRLVHPTREHLVGVEHADNVHDAAAEGGFACPECGVVWTGPQRDEMLTINGLVPVHEGQQVRHTAHGSEIVGDIKRTNLLGVSYHAFHNKFWSLEKICRDEWSAIYSRDADDADLKRRQFAWTMPAEPDVFSITPMTLMYVLDRGGSDDVLGVVPPRTRALTAGVDVGKFRLHYVVRAWYENENGLMTRIVDLGTVPVKSAELGIRTAVPAALSDLRDTVLQPGYQDADGQRHAVQMTLVDGGWQGPVGKDKEYLVWNFMVDCVRQSIGGFLMVLGRGQSEPPRTGSYSQPKKTTKNEVLWVGDNCHIRYSSRFTPAFREAGAHAPACYVIANSDEWKSFLHNGMEYPENAHCAVVPFTARTTEEVRLKKEYASHLRAEERVQKHVAGRGAVIVWEHTTKKANHYFDADYYSCVAANVLELPIASRNVRFEYKQDQPLVRPVAGVADSDGNYLATSRSDD